MFDFAVPSDIARVSVFNLIALSHNRLFAPKIDVCGYDAIQPLVVSLGVRVTDAGLDLAFKIFGQIVINQQDAVLCDLVPAFFLALNLWGEWHTADMLYFLSFQSIGQISRDITRTIIAK